MSAPGLDSAARLDLPMWGGKFGLLVPKEAVAYNASARAQQHAGFWLARMAYLSPPAEPCPKEPA